MDSTPTPSGPLVTGLNHAAVVTADLDRLAAFYVEVFDGEQVDVPSPPGTRSVIVRLGPTAGLALMEAPGNAHVSGSPEMLARGHLDHVALEVPGAAALDTVRRRLVARQASDGAVHDYGPLLCVPFTDPDGMASEVCWVRDPAFADAHPPRPLAGSLADLA